MHRACLTQAYRGYHETGPDDDVAIGVHRALVPHGLERVALIDLDVPARSVATHVPALVGAD